MAVWVVRGGSARGLHEEEFLSEKSIGVYFGADIDLTGATRAEIEADVRDFYLGDYDSPGKATEPSSVKRVVTRFTNQMLLFRDSIQVGDTILMPRKKSSGRRVAVGQVASCYEFWEGAEYPHRRQVRWEQESVPRDSFPYEWLPTNQQTIIPVG